MAFIDHIPDDFNSVNKTIQIPTMPSVVLDTDKTNDKMSPKLVQLNQLLIKIVFNSWY